MEVITLDGNTGKVLKRENQNYINIIKTKSY